MHSIMESVRLPVLLTHGETQPQSTKMPMVIVLVLLPHIRIRGGLPLPPIEIPMVIQSEHPQAVPILGAILRQPIRMPMAIVQVLLPVVRTHGGIPIRPIRTAMVIVQAVLLPTPTRGETPPQPIETPMVIVQEVLQAAQTHGAIVTPNSVVTIPIQVSGPGKL